MRKFIPRHVLLNRLGNKSHVGAGIGVLTIVKIVLGPQKIHNVVLHVAPVTITLQKIGREHLTLVGIFNLQEITGLLQGGNAPRSNQKTPTQERGIVHHTGNGKLLLFEDQLNGRSSL